MHGEDTDLHLPPEAQVERAADAFRMLADPTRIRLLWLLLQGDNSVNCLAELVGVSPTVVSQHLGKLRLSGIVRGRREGTFIHYSLADEHVRTLLEDALSHADHTVLGIPADADHAHEPARPRPRRRTG